MLHGWNEQPGRLQFLKHLGVSFVVGLKSNRIVATQPDNYHQTSEVDIFRQGLDTHQKKFPFVKGFWTA